MKKYYWLSVLFLLFFCISTTRAQEAPVLEWAKSWGNNGNDGVSNIATDVSGNAYLTGTFYNTVDFDPGPDAFNLTSVFGGDAYILKLDVDGNFVWAKSWGNIQDIIFGGITLDASGNMYMVGTYKGTQDLDPGPGVFELTSLGTSQDIFMLKLDSDGNFIWAKSFGGTLSENAGTIAIDAKGNIFFVGNFNGTSDFDPGPGTAFLSSTGQTDIYVCKLDANGNFIWVKQMGGSSYDVPSSLHIDGLGNLYTTGYFVGTSDFNPGAPVYNFTSTGDRSVFISKLDNDGNFVWAKSIDGTGLKIGNDITTDAARNVLIVGRFQETIDLDPGIPILNFTAVGYDDTFIIKLAEDGNLIWAKSFGGVSIDYGISINSDVSGNKYTAGLFQGLMDFDPGSGVFNLTSLSGYDPFISKLDSDGNFVWATHIRGTGGGFITVKSTLDTFGNIYTTGNFRGDLGADMDPGLCAFNLTSGSIFIQKLSIGTASAGSVATITAKGSTLTASPGEAYQWYVNDNAVTGATDQSFELNSLEYAVYKVEVSSTGCTSTSSDFVYLITESEESIRAEWRVHPNPFTTEINISSPSMQSFEIELVDALGRQIQTTSSSNNLLDTRNLNVGQYILLIHTDKKTLRFRVTKMFTF